MIKGSTRTGPTLSTLLSMNPVVPLTVSVTEVWAQFWFISNNCMRIRDLLA